MGILGEAPRFTTELSTVTTEQGKPAKLSCVAIGNPRPTVTWILDGEPLIDSDTYVTEYHEDGTVVLTITETYQEDEGEYVAEATNIFGTVHTTAELILSGTLFNYFPFLLINFDDRNRILYGPHYEKTCIWGIYPN